MHILPNSWIRSTSSLTFAAVFACALVSCDQDTVAPTSNPLQQQIVDANEDGETDLVDHQHPDEVVNHVNSLGIDPSTAVRKSVNRPDGSVEDLYLVEDDIYLSPEQLGILTQEEGQELKSRQYATNNLVGINTISVIGYTGRGYALTRTQRIALQWAVNNYNALNTNKTFTLRFGARTDGDIVVYRNGSESGAGGVAGFPADGRPYKWIQLFGGMDNYDTNTNEHVITHEIGHCMGLRHTDYATRASCNQRGEGAGSIGANYIPGTPRGYDRNSVMLACFGSGEDGEFGYYDKVALEYLY